MKKEVFYTRKVMGSGAKTKGITRILCQFGNLSNASCALVENDVLRDKLSKAIYDMYWELLKMDDIYYEYIKIEQSLSDTIKSQVDKGVYNISEIEYDDPNNLFISMFDEFFWHLRRVLRYRVKFLKIIYPHNNCWEKFKSRNQKLNEFITKKNMSQEGERYYRYVLKEYNQMIKKYTDIRNSFEHNENEHNKLFDIIPFKLSTKDSSIIFNRMTYKDDEITCPCGSLMKIAFENVYHHMEDFLALLYSLNMPYGFYTQRTPKKTNRKLENFEIDLKDFSYEIFYI